MVVRAVWKWKQMSLFCFCETTYALECVLTHAPVCVHKNTLYASGIKASLKINIAHTQMWESEIAKGAGTTLEELGWMSGAHHGLNIDFNLCSHFHLITTPIKILPLLMRLIAHVSLQHNICQSLTNYPWLWSPNTKHPGGRTNRRAKRKVINWEEGKDDIIDKTVGANYREGDNLSNLYCLSPRPPKGKEAYLIQNRDWCPFHAKHNNRAPLRPEINPSTHKPIIPSYHRVLTPLWGNCTL